MNGKAAKMLRRFRRGDKKSKRLFNSLDRNTKAKIRKLDNENVKLVNIDFLKEVTGR
jgi:lipid II:glycine glycyltransferase (peptidoglycan interpeptide bridge formation enzyme)